MSNSETLDAQFDKKPLAEFICKTEAIKSQISPESLSAFNEYCSRVENLLTNNSVAVCKDPEVTTCINEETNRVVHDLEKISLKWDLRKYVGINAVNDDNFWAGQQAAS